MEGSGVTNGVITRGHLSALLALALGASPLLAAPNISPLGRAPDWQAFQKYQKTITHDEFVRLLQELYCTRGVPDHLIHLETDTVKLLTDRDAKSVFTLRFAKDAAAQRSIPRHWRLPAALPKARKGRELAGLKIALDPGHIGGKWAQMEERWYRIGESKPVQEGDMTLLVSQLVAPRLRALGAKVTLVRSQTEPVTSKRPADFRQLAREVLVRAGDPNPREDFSDPADPLKDHTIRWESELLFYRNSEIRARAATVNGKVRPDLTLCLHFNAEGWEDPNNPKLTDHNHLHLMVNGSFIGPELEYDDVRFEMLERLLSRAHEAELPLAEALAKSMAQRTQLPPYEYTTDNVTKVGTTNYVFARNLIANRLYKCPVVYFEPYVMNSEDVFRRVQEGDYEGMRNVNGLERASIYREYADGVVDGLVEYYRTARHGSP